MPAWLFVGPSTPLWLLRCTETTAGRLVRFRSPQHTPINSPTLATAADERRRAWLFAG
jgi:hypothetical protein